MTSFTDIKYPFDLSVENGQHEQISILNFSTILSKAENHSLDLTQLWLSRGLVWYYAFNHEEAIVCFQNALKVGGNPIMSHYGISICHGPNYNTETMNRDSFPSAKDAFEHAQKAMSLLEENSTLLTMSPIEVALVRALRGRFNDTTGLEVDAAVEQNTEAYAESLSKVYADYPECPCVACLYAEALLNISPWVLWDLNTGVPKEHASKAKIIIEKALLIAPKHPGLNHFMVHLMEMSPTPEAALPSCEVLTSTLFPHAGHLTHMPSHIYVLLGMWKEAVDANVRASIADAAYVEKEGIFNYYTGYRIHNLHFISYAAMFAGSYSVALQAAIEIQQNLPESLLRNPMMNKFFESFLSIELHVLIRFGKWDVILAKTVPSDSKIYSYTIAMHHYARGIAHAVLGDVVAANNEITLMRTSTHSVSVDHVLHNNLCTDLLTIAEHMLMGEIAYREGNYDVAFADLECASRISDELVYDEPWGWMQPPAHALGALMLEQGRVDQAEYYFRRDMDKNRTGRCHPDNIWALCGLQKCLQHRYSLLSASSSLNSPYTKRIDCCGGDNDNVMNCKDKTTSSEFQEAATVLLTELDEIKLKIASLSSLGDTDVKVACMCARF